MEWFVNDEVEIFTGMRKWRFLDAIASLEPGL